MAFQGNRPLRPLGTEDVFEAARNRDDIAAGVIEGAGRVLASGIHLLALAGDPERTVKGRGHA